MYFLFLSQQNLGEATKSLIHRWNKRKIWRHYFHGSLFDLLRLKDGQKVYGSKIIKTWNAIFLINNILFTIHYKSIFGTWSCYGYHCHLILPCLVFQIPLLQGVSQVHPLPALNYASLGLSFLTVSTTLPPAWYAVLKLYTCSTVHRLSAIKSTNIKNCGSMADIGCFYDQFGDKILRFVIWLLE